ncbi:nucleotidyl transferase AbiEii/AbiGii toxin family protein [Rhodophyticola sp. CCM32]|uniref:nucleotidyl transferase AbiEii/AbiGii toxin family protein n=1 Tax=Rhodophyticola sp. CCM32 TaxID=2916397 RepID=UPI00107F4D4A|nr:nucleotidyl transferase AbiEii/AbiGii toxin family protein [Rhodophyticola sp. CCM32]QBX99317.1 nucleotidyl transferase AbiEii/AbiGii toxin family protein [Rhodophyticola sp. CCM32]
MAIDERYRQQVELLVRTLPSVAAESVFALKGGTAINLFVRDLPRLSVDIDLTYLPVKPRNESLSDIDETLQRIGKSISETLSDAKVFPSRLDKEGTLNRLIVRSPEAQIKIEVTPVTRGCVFEPTVMPVSEKVEEQFSFAETLVVSFDDLYAGKLVAALDRQHPRDLFDVRDLLANEGVSDTLRQAFLVYIVSHNRPAAEVLAPRRKDIEQEFQNNFVGMTTTPVRIEDLIAAREQMIETVVGQMPQGHREFLVGVERGDVRWQLADLQEVAELPAIRWKLSNLEKVPSNRRETFAANLAAIWD